MMIRKGTDDLLNSVQVQSALLDNAQTNPKLEQYRVKTPPRLLLHGRHLHRLSQPTLTPGMPQTSYTVQSGEDLSCIAQRFNVDPSETFILNELSNARALFAGLVVRIPQTGSPFPAIRILQNHPTTYTVLSAAETLYSIACKYGDVDPAPIASANGLSIGAALTPGQQLSIP